VRRRRARRVGSRRRRRGTGGRRRQSRVSASGPAANNTPGHAPRDDVRRGRGCRTLGYCDTAGQVRQQGSGANQLFGHGVLRGAGIHNGISIEAALVLEHRAVLDDAGLGRARLDGAREDAAVPPVQKVAVQSVTGRVAVREDEASAVVQSVEWRDVEVDLVEDGDEVDRVCGRAQAIVDAIGVRHV